MNRNFQHEFIDVKKEKTKKEKIKSYILIGFFGFVMAFMLGGQVVSNLFK